MIYSRNLQREDKSPSSLNTVLYNHLHLFLSAAISNRCKECSYYAREHEGSSSPTWKSSINNKRKRYKDRESNMMSLTSDMNGNVLLYC